MSLLNKIKMIKLVYFSGTGGAARVADAFEKALTSQEKVVIKHELNSRNSITNDGEDMLFVIYSVHACNAPEPVYSYIDAISDMDKIPAVVISVSGGGEVTPNTASRMHCIKRLENKGYDVVYEKMLVMPSNFIVATGDELAVRLIEILPFKVQKIVSDISTGVRRRTKPNSVNRFLAYIGEFEKKYTKSFGNKIIVNDNCIGCGWCEKSCPMENIRLINRSPNFKDRCVICLRCIYGCPQSALSAGIGKFIVIKQGFSLKDIEARVGEPKKYSVEELAKGYLWKGIEEYLLEDEKVI